MALSNPFGDLGPWADAHLADTARLWVGLGADADIPPPLRFLSAVAHLIKKRTSTADDGDPKRPAVFLLQPTPPPAPLALTRVPMLDNGLTAIGNRLWFVGELVVAGRFADLGELDDEAIFHLITSELGLGTVPAVIFDPRPPVPEARFYPGGLQDVENYVPVNLGAGPVSLDQIFDAITSIHESCLVTPEAQVFPGKLWENSDKWWASKDAESLVQLNLKAGLVGKFPTCRIRHEQPGTSGRLDLEIEENDRTVPGKVVRYAILELKVLRAYGKGGKAYGELSTKEWIESGVGQAAAYRTERNALAAALCCFDMRPTVVGHACFAHVLELAANLAVRLGTWHLFATSALYREQLNKSAQA
jgi:hypothetical protein